MDRGEAQQPRVEVHQKIEYKPELPPRTEGETTAGYLRRLEETGRYLFHGSPSSDITILEPRLSTDMSGDPRVHNVMAVFAIEKPALACQRAILPKRDSIKGKWRVSSGMNPNKTGEPLLEISGNIEVGTGTIYVLPRGKFEYIEGFGQWKSTQPVEPVSTLSVSKDDYFELGGKIEVRSD